MHLGSASRKESTASFVTALPLILSQSRFLILDNGSSDASEMLSPCKAKFRTVLSRDNSSIAFCDSEVFETNIVSVLQRSKRYLMAFSSTIGPSIRTAAQVVGQNVLEFRPNNHLEGPGASSNAFHQRTFGPTGSIFSH